MRGWAGAREGWTCAATFGTTEGGRCAGGLLACAAAFGRGDGAGWIGVAVRCASCW